MPEKLLFEMSKPGRKGTSVPSSDVPTRSLTSFIPENHLRKENAKLPEVSENEIMRHFVRISTLNHHIDKGFYPLGSCTMKYNPKIDEVVAAMPSFARVHPQQAWNEDTVQGALRVMYELGEYLKEITGMKDITLQPAAGAHGELTALMMIRAYHQSKGNPRKKVLIPDSAHGTNPASVTTNGYEVVTVKSGSDGLTDVEDLKSKMDTDVAAFMITNPNTVGMFEQRIKEIIDLIHQVGGLIYMDGANLNALLGIVRPGDVGFDAVHINLHKTFSTPHGGGGPGSGPVAVGDRLKDFLPVPKIVKKGDHFGLDHSRKKSIGKIHAFFGNFGMHVRAYTYIRLHGPDGLRSNSENAILNANYIRKKLGPYYELPFKNSSMHEVVFSGDRQKARGVKTLDIAKRLLDFGVHAPTIYFPLIVHEAIMIEPTESETPETLDHFIQAMIQIDQETQTDPQKVLGAPHSTPVGRLDDARAVRQLDIKFLGDLK